MPNFVFSRITVVAGHSPTRKVVKAVGQSVVALVPVFLAIYVEEVLIPFS